jgi:hypothetical protein
MNTGGMTMTAEQLLIEAWRKLPEHRQQEVLDFTQFLAQYSRSESGSSSMSESVSESIQSESPLESSALGQKLQSIRDRIVASGMPLLTAEEVEQEVLERRGGYQG